MSERETINKWLNYYADKFGVNRDYVHAIAHIESRHRHHVDGSVITSPAGAVGVMQLMPETAEDLGVNRYNLKDNIKGGVKYFAQRIKLADGDINKAIAMYYSGIGNVQRNDSLNWPSVQRYISNFWDLVGKEPPKRELIAVGNKWHTPITKLTSGKLEGINMDILFLLIFVIILAVILSSLKGG